MTTKTVRWIWELPQCLLGLILIKLYKAELKSKYNNIPIYVGKKMQGAISLGLYIIASERSYKDINTQKHEWGHTRQSLMLGLLYLLTVGISSICWAWLHNIIMPNKSYYWFWTEVWADKLGGVKRNESK